MWISSIKLSYSNPCTLTYIYLCLYLYCRHCFCLHLCCCPFQSQYLHLCPGFQFHCYPFLHLAPRFLNFHLEAHKQWNMKRATSWRINTGMWNQSLHIKSCNTRQKNKLICHYFWQKSLKHFHIKRSLLFQFDRCGCWQEGKKTVRKEKKSRTKLNLCVKCKEKRGGVTEYCT